MPLGRPSDPRALLPAQQETLAAANALLIDWAFDALHELQQGLDVEQVELWPFLPSAFAAAYGIAFFRRFAVCLTSVGLKLRAPGPQSVASLAEGLALLAMTSVAAELLDQPSGATALGVWFAAVCPNAAVLRLFDVPAATARRAGRTERLLSEVDGWFQPIDRTALLSPYFDAGVV